MGQQGTVVVTGFVGADPVRFGREGGSIACSFRVGSTRRYFHTASGEWREHPTTWITVKAFRVLAEHILDSLHIGDPVIVTGQLTTETWQQDGVKRTRIVIEAGSVGHDLLHGTSMFRRSREAKTTRRTSDDGIQHASIEASASPETEAVHRPDAENVAERHGEEEGAGDGVPNAHEEFATSEF